MSKSYLLALLCIAYSPHTFAQADTTKREKVLSEVFLAASKWEQHKDEIPHKIVKISPEKVLFENPQTAADLLGQTGAVFIQKSQLGGGSPMIRGFATNRVLIVIDGVRMNNAIYRSGNLQNVLSIDPLSIGSAEVIFGPGSMVYGSDAIGGVMDFHTLQPQLSTGKVFVKGNALARYSSANGENSGHVDVNFGGKKISALTSLSFSRFYDLKMGKHGGQPGYLRKEYVQRINGIDSIMQNTNPLVQRFSGYEQLNVLQKLRYKASENLDLQYSFTYAGTGNAARYDRLIQYRQGKLRFAEWYYGPMLWRMHTLEAMHTKKNSLYDRSKLVMAYQDYEESRIDRARGNSNRNKQVEKVGAFSVNWDAEKRVNANHLFYGAEVVHNDVESFGQTTNIASGVTKGYVSRYPESTVSFAALYGSYRMELSSNVNFTTGLRYSFNKLHAEFDTTYIRFPYTKASLQQGALTGNAGVIFKPGTHWQWTATVATGYRMPNVDDIRKLFESAPGNITVPNVDLRAEYAVNFEVGVLKKFAAKHKLELNAFYTILNDAIVRRPFTFNGADSILFGGVNSRVEALQNASKATVWGLQATAQFTLAPGLLLESHANYTHGKETDDLKDEQVPLRHAAPFFGSTFIKYHLNKFRIETSVMYN
ncbi:MAG: TonB-dependent receptor, partial [Chitinophagaceae bacterium]